jgi:hypothetical protein
MAGSLRSPGWISRSSAAPAEPPSLRRDSLSLRSSTRLDPLARRVMLPLAKPPFRLLPSRRGGHSARCAPLIMAAFASLTRDGFLASLADGHDWLDSAHPGLASRCVPRHSSFVVRRSSFWVAFFVLRFSFFVRNVGPLVRERPRTPLAASRERPHFVREWPVRFAHRDGSLARRRHLPSHLRSGGIVSRYARRHRWIPSRGTVVLVFSLLVLRSSFFVLRSSFFVLRSSFFVLRSSFLVCFTPRKRNRFPL